MLAERLKEVRLNAGASRRDAAIAMGVSDAAYGYFEQGLKTPSFAVLKRFAEHFNVSLDYLAEREVVNADKSEEG